MNESWLVQWGRNQVFLSSLTAWLSAQTIKVFLGILREKRFNFRWFLGSGGMPSSHAALVTCLMTSIGFAHGFDSALFAMALGFTVVTMFDAQGVRRQSGEQAEVLNKILDDIYRHRAVEDERLKELFGHTPLEVFAGAFLGVAIALLFRRFGFFVA